MKKNLSALLFPVLIFLSACDEPATPVQAQDSATAYVVALNSPLQTFAKRLTTGRVEIKMPTAAEPDPSQWQPSIDEIQVLQGAQLILLNGAGYSSWLNRVSLSDSRLVVTSKASEKEWIELGDQVTHSHGPTGEHAHSGYAFTTWLDMQIAAQQARATATALQRRWPEMAEDVSRELERLLAEIDSLDKAYLKVAGELAGRQIIFSHPVYQYFERRYRLTGLSLHWEPDVNPSDEQWGALQNQLQSNTLFVWESIPLPAIADRMTAMGVEQVILDPGANTSGDDWLALQSLNIKALKRVVAPK
jgi:zinc transport system substrate-binding protein